MNAPATTTTMRRGTCTRTIPSMIEGAPLARAELRRTASARVRSDCIPIRRVRMNCTNIKLPQQTNFAQMYRRPVWLLEARHLAIWCIGRERVPPLVANRLERSFQTRTESRRSVVGIQIRHRRRRVDQKQDPPGRVQMYAQWRIDFKVNENCVYVCPRLIDRVPPIDSVRNKPQARTADVM